MKKIILLAITTIIMITVSCCEPKNNNKTQANVKTEQACSINNELRETIRAYFINNPATPPKDRRDREWTRAIILKKLKVITNEVEITLMLYCQNGAISFVHSSRTSCSGGANLDLLSSAGSDIFINMSDDSIDKNEIIIVRENAVCQDNVTIFGD